VEQDARLLTVSGELEHRLIAKGVLVVGVHLAALAVVLRAYSMRPDLAASHLIAPSCDHKLVVHAFAVDDFADNDFPLAVDLLQNLRVVILEGPAGCIVVLLVCEYLIDVLVFEVPD
jgi:hypothetical protein